MKLASVEVYTLVAGKYQLMAANERGHYPISALGVELGIWQGQFQNAELPWLRWWDNQGNLLLTGSERAEEAELLLQEERKLLEKERQKTERLAAQLRAMGIEPQE